MGGEEPSNKKLSDDFNMNNKIKHLSMSPERNGIYNLRMPVINEK